MLSILVFLDSKSVGGLVPPSEWMPRYWVVFGGIFALVLAFAPGPMRKAWTKALAAGGAVRSSLQKGLDVTLGLDELVWREMRRELNEGMIKATAELRIPMAEATSKLWVKNEGLLREHIQAFKGLSAFDRPRYREDLEYTNGPGNEGHPTRLELLLNAMSFPEVREAAIESGAWIEDRRARARVPVPDWSGHITVDRTTQAILIKDISEGGVCAQLLDGTCEDAGLIEEKPVQLKMLGTKLPSKVRWTRKRTLGIQFT